MVEVNNVAAAAPETDAEKAKQGDDKRGDLEKVEPICGFDAELQLAWRAKDQDRPGIHKYAREYCERLGRRAHGPSVAVWREGAARPVAEALTMDLHPAKKRRPDGVAAAAKPASSASAAAAAACRDDDDKGEGSGDRAEDKGSGDRAEDKQDKKTKLEGGDKATHTDAKAKAKQKAKRGSFGAAAGKRAVPVPEVAHTTWRCRLETGEMVSVKYRSIYDGKKQRGQVKISLFGDARAKATNIMSNVAAACVSGNIGLDDIIKRRDAEVLADTEGPAVAGPGPAGQQPKFKDKRPAAAPQLAPPASSGEAAPAAAASTDDGPEWFDEEFLMMDGDFDYDKGLEDEASASQF